MKLLAVVVPLILVVTAPAKANLFEKGALSAAAFECAKLAEIAIAHDPVMLVEPGENERLFKLGLDEGGNFAKEILAGKYDPKEDLLDTFQWSLAGAPSVDFLVGRLAEFSQRRALEELPKKEITREWTADTGRKARETYLEKNCHLLR